MPDFRLTIDADKLQHGRSETPLRKGDASGPLELSAFLTTAEPAESEDLDIEDKDPWDDEDDTGDDPDAA